MFVQPHSRNMYDMQFFLVANGLACTRALPFHEPRELSAMVAWFDPRMAVCGRCAVCNAFAKAPYDHRGLVSGSVRREVQKLWQQLKSAMKKVASKLRSIKRKLFGHSENFGLVQTAQALAVKQSIAGGYAYASESVRLKMKERIDGYLASLLHRIDAVLELEATFHRMGMAPVPALCNSPRPFTCAIKRNRTCLSTQDTELGQLEDADEMQQMQHERLVEEAEEMLRALSISTQPRELKMFDSTRSANRSISPCSSTVNQRQRWSSILFCCAFSALGLHERMPMPTWQCQGEEVGGDGAK